MLAAHACAACLSLHLLLQPMPHPYATRQLLWRLASGWRLHQPVSWMSFGCSAGPVPVAGRLPRDAPCQHVAVGITMQIFTCTELSGGQVASEERPASFCYTGEHTAVCQNCSSGCNARCSLLQWLTLVLHTAWLPMLWQAAPCPGRPAYPFVRALPHVHQLAQATWPASLSQSMGVQ